MPCYAKVLLGNVDFATANFNYVLAHFLVNTPWILSAVHHFRWISRVQGSESTMSACRHFSCGSLRRPVSSMWMMIAGISSSCECLIQIRFKFSLYQHWGILIFVTFRHNKRTVQIQGRLLTACVAFCSLPQKIIPHFSVWEHLQRLFFLFSNALLSKRQDTIRLKYRPFQ